MALGNMAVAAVDHETFEGTAGEDMRGPGTVDGIRTTTDGVLNRMVISAVPQDLDQCRTLMNLEILQVVHKHHRHHPFMGRMEKA